MAARLAVFLTGGALLTSLAAAQTLDEERQALARAQQQARAAGQRATMLEGRARNEQDRVEQALAQSAAVATRIQATEAEIGAAEARIRVIERLRARQRARLAARQEPAVRLLAALQIMARRPPALALVQPGSTRHLVHTRALFSAMLPLVRQRTAGLRQEIEAGRRLRGEAGRALASLNGSQRRLAAERAGLVRLAAERRRASQNFAAGAMAAQDRATAMGEEARDITDLMGQLRIDAAKGEALASLPGPLLRPAVPGAAALPVERSAAASDRLPYRLPVAGRIVTGLGEVSREGVRARGVTIAAQPLAQVVSPAPGRVAFAGPFRGFGAIVIIDHGGGWTTLVTGLGTLDLRVGDTLVQGSPVGRVGSDGRVMVELRRGQQPIDITRLVG